MSSGINFLRGTAIIVVLAGAVGSESFMFHVGRHNNSRLLLALFAIWVLAPFAALIRAQVLSQRWPVRTQAVSCIATLAIVLISLTIYGHVALGPPRPKPAAMFLIVPLVSLLLIAIVVPLARRQSRRDHRD
jgi:hypothetical protein